MADVLSELYNACDPLAAALPDQYVDASVARGEGSDPEGAFVHQYIRQLTLAKSGRYVKTLFTGHIGCGKSSELLHLAHLLRQGKQGICCFPVYIDTSQYLDDFDVTPADILLAISAQVAAELRSRHEIDMSDSYIVKRLDELRRLFLSDIDLEKLEVSGGAVKLPFTLLKKDRAARQKVRESLRPTLSSLSAELNTFLEAARQKIGLLGGYTDIVLILDNLEKIQRVADKAEGTLSQRELFIERSAQLTDIRAHTIFTVPLSLTRSSGMLLGQIYGEAPFVLPMVKTFDRESRAPYERGRNSLAQIIERRLSTFTLDQAIGKEALDWVLDYSGGSVRTMLTLVQQAATYVEKAPLTLDAVKFALRPLINQYSGAIPNSYWDKLAALEGSVDQHIDNSDPDFQAMLEQLIVMEYVNGGDESNIFADSAPWYAVNPIVRELAQFKSAVSHRN